MTATQRSTDILTAGAVVDAYRIKTLLGAGGFGVTYRAEHMSLGKDFAIKEYFPRGFARREGTDVSAATGASGTYKWGLERFLGEARALAKFHHRAIVGVSNVFQANGTAYMVLTYERGRDLRAWSEALGRPASQAELDAILGDLLDALEVLHATGLLHRDIAPDNIYIRTDGTPVLLDFGAARHALGQHSTQMSAIVKSGFSPPEQYTTDAKAQGPWTDIYALGATLYTIITGSRPPESSLRMLKDTLVPARQAARGAYRAGFLGAIDQALALVPENRPQSIAIWKQSLIGTPLTSPPTSSQPPAQAALAPASRPTGAAPTLAGRPEPTAVTNAVNPGSSHGTSQGGWSGLASAARPSPAAPAEWHRPAIAAGIAVLCIGLAGALALALRRPAAPPQPASLASQLPAPPRADGKATCDQLAAVPFDKTARAAGVSPEALELPRAVDTCRQAVATASAGDRPRLQAQLAHAHFAAGQFAESARLAEAASAAGQPAAQNLFGDFLYDGIPPVALDRTRACGLYEQASHTGHATALTNLGVCHFNGQGGIARDEKRGFALFRQAADLGMRDAMWAVGLRLRDGHGTAQNIPEAIRWLEKAAAAGQAGALVSLAHLYDSGYGVERDTGKANALFAQARPVLERLAAVHDFVAMDTLGEMLRDGRGAIKDEAAAAKLFRRAAGLGSSSSMVNLAGMLSRGVGLPADLAEAQRLLAVAAARGHDDAMRDIGTLHEDGRGVPQNLTEALRWYRAAADSGSADAMNRLGNFYDQGKGVKQDHAEAVRWYGRSAERGYATGMASIGSALLLGDGVKKDLAAARRWYTRAASLGNVEAMRFLGDLYADGNGVAVNGPEAISWYKRAADRGDADALNLLGQLHLHGKGVAKNGAEAAIWYQRAIERDHSEAYNNLGLLYQEGNGVTQNLTEAARLYRIASDKGSVVGMYNLGLLYEDGRGVPKSCREAVSWFKRAADGGDKDAPKRLAALKNCR